MNDLVLYEEYRLVERSEYCVSRAWKGAHLLLFFLAFVFGSFCTFCFHMLMYLFEEKCVLFPKLLSLTSMRHNVIYEFMPPNSDLSDLPVDFVSTQWVEKSTCALPTYVPLVSGIFGLVWTTMFLMCSTGTRTLTGLERPWRILPPVFIFSLAMSILCIYSSVITHSGLQQLCIKLGEITGTSTCTYAVNVVTLVYERRIRGVYQATRLTIVSAWLHTACWLCSALLTLVRVLLAVDFQLVRVKERNETHLRTFLPDDPSMKDNSATTKSNYNVDDDGTVIIKDHDDLMSSVVNQLSDFSLVEAGPKKEEGKRDRGHGSRKKRFIQKILNDLLDKTFPPEKPSPYLDEFVTWDDELDSFITYPHENDNIKSSEVKSKTTDKERLHGFNEALNKGEVDVQNDKRKSNLKNVDAQNDEKNKSTQKKVLMSDKDIHIDDDQSSRTDQSEPQSDNTEPEKKTEVRRKEKQD